MNQIFKITKKELEKYLDKGNTYAEIANFFNCSSWTILNRVKKYGLNSKVRGKSTSKLGARNPAKKLLVRERISASVKKQYALHKKKNLPYGFGENDKNFMFGKNKEKHPNWKGGISKDRKIYKHCYKVYGEKCFICGKEKDLKKEKSNIYIHHLNRIHSDHRAENVIPVCDSCHQKLHRWWRGWNLKVMADIDYGHHLPNHRGKCYFSHGHTAIINLTVQGLIKEDGMVVDFKWLKDSLKQCIEPLDHSYLNSLEGEPTSEQIASFIFHQVEMALYKIRVSERRIVWVKELEMSEGLNKSIIINNL